MKSGAKGAKSFSSTKIGRFFSPNFMTNDDFSEPPRRADSKKSIFFFSRFLRLGHLQGLGVRLGRILGVLSIEPFLGEGGGPAGGPYRPLPPGNENPASLFFTTVFMVRNLTERDCVPIVEGNRGCVMFGMSPPAHNNILRATATHCCLF